MSKTRYLDLDGTVDDPAQAIIASCLRFPPHDLPVPMTVTIGGTQYEAPGLDGLVSQVAAHRHSETGKMQSHRDIRREISPLVCRQMTAEDRVRHCTNGRLREAAPSGESYAGQTLAQPGGCASCR